MKQAERIKIYAEWKKEANIWVASSSDICGLETEAGTLQALEDRLKEMIPELFQLNGIKGEAVLIVNFA